MYFTDAVFRARLAALTDLYMVLAHASKSLQNLQLLPWERKGAYQQMVNNLRLKRACLPAPERRDGTIRLEGHAILDALDEGDPEEMASRWPNLSKYSAQLSMQQVCNMLICF